MATSSFSAPPEYAERVDGEYVIPAVSPAYLNERNRRQWVDYNGSEEPGTLVVDPFARFLYHVVEPGLAMRFGIAVGREGYGFRGDADVRRREEYPGWMPTQNMIRQEPDLYGPLAAGLPGGLDNPLGARALYLYRGGVDTMYRIHGTMDPSSIGKATSAGCIRLFNQDIIDLFDESELGMHVKGDAPKNEKPRTGRPRWSHYRPAIWSPPPISRPSKPMPHPSLPLRQQRPPLPKQQRPQRQQADPETTTPPRLGGGVGSRSIRTDQSTQCTAVRSFACVGEFSQRPSILALATPVFANWNR